MSIKFGGIGSGLRGSQGETGPAFSVPITSHIYVDFRRADSYTANGSRELPYKTLAAAYSAAAGIASSSNPIAIVLVSGNTSAENVTFSKGHIFLTGDNSSGTSAPIVFTGSLTFTGPNASISENHFAIFGIQLVGVSGTNVVTFSGTYPQRLFIKDVWITAEGSSHGITMTNTGTASSVRINDSKFGHNGSGHYHCINVAKGAANIYSIETSGVLSGVVGVDSGATCNIANSEIQSAGSYAIDVYAGGVLSLSNCKIITTAANSIGIKLDSATAFAIIGNVVFSVPTSSSTGRAISGVSGTYLYYGDIYFLPDAYGQPTNRKISSAITSATINNTIDFV